MECLDDNVVSEFVSGALPPSLLTRVEGHLAGCRDCRTLVAAPAADAMADSNIETIRHEKMSASQVAAMPKKTPAVGDRVGRYLVLSVLGAGGMGVVFAAYDPQLDRKVALKLLRSGTKLDARDAQKRLRREAQAIAQLSHPNVVGVYDVGTTEDDDLYIAMEFVEGDTLTSWLKRYPRSIREILDVFLQAGRGLVAAHSVGLLHRDFKPDNVLVGGDGRVRVTDFGLARSLVLDEESGRGPTPGIASALNTSLTATGTVLGTPRYMSPEQLTGPDIDARADQFSFCVALHEALYGEHPLPGGTSVSMHEHGDKALPPPEGARVPAPIVRAVARGLERDRSKRFPTMAALINELVPVVVRTQRRTVLLALGGLIVVGGATATAIVRQNPDSAGPVDPVGVQPFVDEINELKKEIRELNAERGKLLEALGARREVDVGILRRQLETKDRQIQDLIKKVDELKTATTPRAAKVARPSQVFGVVNAVIDAGSSFDPCFGEWSERRDELGNPHVEASLVVRFSVAPSGEAVSIMATGESSPSLRLCVELAVGRIKFPPGTERLDLEVNVGWSQGILNVAPRVVGRR